MSGKERGRSWESKNSAVYPEETGKSMAKGKKWDGLGSAGQEATASHVCVQMMMQQRKEKSWSRQVVLCRESQFTLPGGHLLHPRPHSAAGFSQLEL